MNFENELQRISKTIKDMPIKEFEDMLFDCGLRVIKSSENSNFVKCFSTDFVEKRANYVSRTKNN